ncbi:hypothetical protein B5M44_19200 [Shinella sumterensis]|uniref:hypothetical protein n=1 Tax=Shinella sumterensis TaxID=1967501 RepID=UPI00106E1A34|nr:hypothetical protein [Shinella sumterensis]MCD1266077.1 hypothetical protein [Shinella sumterensis]TFE96566.1 hypothetical protein B5M44_19200 [Shinella sumterensis]
MHPTLIKAAASADAARKRIERVADLLAKLMQDIHGDEWKVDISHEYQTEMVVIIPHPGRRHRKPAAPAPEVA